MNGTLREVLNLPEHKSNGSAAQAGEYSSVFREAMARLNEKMHLVASQASREQHEPLENQRLKLYEAFQKALKVVDPANPTKGAETLERVTAAVELVEEKASTVVADSTTAYDQWLSKEAEFDEAALLIGELEAADHEKAGKLVQLCEAIRERVADREYRESSTLFDQLLPKLEKIHSEHQQSNNGANHGEAGLTTGDREALWKEIEEIERQLELLIAEHQIAI